MTNDRFLIGHFSFVLLFVSPYCALFSFLPLSSLPRFGGLPRPVRKGCAFPKTAYTEKAARLSLAADLGYYSAVSQSLTAPAAAKPQKHRLLMFIVRGAFPPRTSRKVCCPVAGAFLLRPVTCSRCRTQSTPPRGCRKLQRWTGGV